MVRHTPRLAAAGGCWRWEGRGGKGGGVRTEDTALTMRIQMQARRCPRAEPTVRPDPAQHGQKKNNRKDTN